MTNCFDMEKKLLTITEEVKEGKIVNVHVDFANSAIPAIYWVLRRMAKRDDVMGRALRSLTDEEYPEEFIKWTKDFAEI